MAIALKLCIYEPMVAKPKYVWDVADFYLEIVDN